MQNREHLLSLSQRNVTSIEQLESCLFTVSLDDYTYASPNGGSRHSVTDRIKNISSGVDGTNRWFDKSMSLIVESNSRFGMMGEHSPVDALIPSIIADWAISDPISAKEFTDGGVLLLDCVEPLDWDADQLIKSECEAAVTRAQEIINDSDADVLRFDEYGVEWIKRASGFISVVRTEQLWTSFLQASSPLMLTFRWHYN